MPPNIVNLNPRAFQPTQQQQNPTSAMAQLLLSRGSQMDPNVRGSGVRSAGEMILGALLQKKAFEENLDRNQNRAANQGDLINKLFPPEQGELQLGQQFSSQSPDAPSNQPENQGVKFFDSNIGEENVGFTNLPIGQDSPFPSGNSIVNQNAGQEPPIPFVEQERFIPPASGLPDVDDRVPIEKPNQLGELLAGFNKVAADRGGLDPSVIFNTFQGERANRQAAEQEALKFKRNAALKFTLQNKDIESRENISNKTIRSKEEQKRLDREAKAGERIKVNVLLGNDPSTGRPINRIGFAKKNDPSDIVWVGKSTVKGAGNQVNVSNLPQIPSSLLTGITQSQLNLKSIGRIEDIMRKVDISGLVGPIDSPIGTLFEKLGLPDKDQQTIGNISKDLTDSLGRMRSGGVISDQEWETFQALVPQRDDNYQTFINKLNDFKAKMNDIMSVNVGAAKTFGFNTGSATTDDVTQMTDEQLQAIVDGK